MRLLMVAAGPVMRGRRRPVASGSCDPRHRPFFAQDKWTLNRRLTLSLRYDLETVPIDQTGNHLFAENRANFNNPTGDQRDAATFLVLRFDPRRRADTNRARQLQVHVLIDWKFQ
jgi:hypothetical protein